MLLEHNEGVNVMKKIAFATLFTVAATSFAHAEMCDYRPSQLIGAGATSAVGVSSTAVAGAGLAVKAAGFYTLTHAATGATMLGSTAGGASAAGTVGIMGGTAGVLGSAAAIVTAPATIIVAAVASAGIAAFEGGCYFFFDEQIDDYRAIYKIMKRLSENADPAYFQLVVPTRIEMWTEISQANYLAEYEGADYQIVVGKGDDAETYYGKNLYIINGVLKNRDWFRNTTIGNVGFISPNTIKSE